MVRNDWLPITLAFLLWFISSIGQLTKYLGVSGALISAVVAFILIRQLWRALIPFPPRFEVTARHLVLLWVVAILLFAVLYPIAKSGIVGPGSDRDSSENAALLAMTRGEFPYYTTSHLGNPLSLLPGALILGLPFFLIGTVIFQNPFWLGVLVLLCRRIFSNASMVAFYILLFFIGAVGVMQDFVTGGDYTTNAIYVAVTIGLVILLCQNQEKSRRLVWLASMLLGVAVCSRVIYLVLIPVVLGFVRHSRGERLAIEIAIVLLTTVSLLNLPYYFFDPSHFTPLDLTGKLSHVPAFFKPELTLPLLGVLISFSGFLLKADAVRVYGIAAIALATLIFPEMLFAIAKQGWNEDTLIQLGYLAPVTIFGGLWVTAKFCEPRPA